MINLCLVVIATQFSETKKRETERMLQERKRFHSTSTLASNSEPGGCYKEILKYIAHLFRRGRRQIVKIYYEARGRTHPHRKIKPEFSMRKKKKKGTQKAKSTPLLTSSTPCPYCAHTCNYYFQLLNATENNHISRRNSSPLAPRASPEMSDIDSVSSPRRPNFLTVPSICSSRPSSSDSVNTLAVAAAEALSPAFLKCSPNHLMPHPPPITRASSLNSEYSIGRKHGLPPLPEMMSLHCSKNASLMSTNTLIDCCTCGGQAKLTNKGEYSNTNTLTH